MPTSKSGKQRKQIPMEEAHFHVCQTAQNYPVKGVNRHNHAGVKLRILPNDETCLEE